MNATQTMCSFLVIYEQLFQEILWNETVPTNEVLQTRS